MTAPISVQLYSVREAFVADPTGTLQRLRALGFDNVEPYDLSKYSAHYRAALDVTGLNALSAHDSLFGKDDVAERLSLAASLGVTTLIDAFLPEERWSSRESLEAAAAELGEIARVGADLGVEVGYHNHWWELSSVVDGVPALEIFAELLPETVRLEVDTYWAEVGGVSAPELLRRLGSRVALIHVKDGPRTRDTAAQLPAGQGSMPVEEVLAAAPNAIRVIEFDAFAGDVFEGITASLSWLEARR